MKAKVGDVIVLTDGRRTALDPSLNGKAATVISVKPDKVFVRASELGVDMFGDYYIYHDCYELEVVYSSPLYKALL